MYVRRIKIENVRGFGAKGEGVDLDLARPDGRYAGWTVLAGRNGTGKATLLRAVALSLLGPLAARTQKKDLASVDASSAACTASLHAHPRRRSRAEGPREINGSANI